jgi:predicted AAA+ superfamily ATPase
MSNNKILIRNYYIEKIKPFIDKSLIKVLVGQRRVGKSYILLQLIEYIKTNLNDYHIIYINKEDILFRFIKTGIDLHNYVQSQRDVRKKNYIFIDEIQDIQEFEVALRSLLLDTQNDIFITGSNAHLLSSDLSGYLSGRYVEFNIHSLSYLEFLQFHKKESNEHNFEQYLKFGGLPYLIHLPLEEHIIFDYVKSVYNTILYRDIVNRYTIRNTLFLENLCVFLAQQIGNLFSAKSISDFLKSQQVNMPSNLVQLYATYISNACLVHKAERYDVQGKRKFKKKEKYYFEDLGIRNVVAGYSIDDRAKLFENIVFNHLISKGYVVKVGVLGDKEIDFVTQKNNETKYFQVALQMIDDKTIQREFGNLLAIKDNYPKYVISKDIFSGNTYQGIEHWNIIDFLLKFE